MIRVVFAAAILAAPTFAHADVQEIQPVTAEVWAIGDQSSTARWPGAYLAMEATGAAHIVPGRGLATAMEEARADTYHYLMNLSEQIRALLDEGGDIMAAPQVDQLAAPQVDRAAFSYLEQFDSLAGRNAQTAFQQMEWE